MSQETQEVVAEAPVIPDADAEAIARYQESQATQSESEGGVPEGYNPDGTPVEELLAGKFKSQEDLLAAYKELEQKLGKGSEESNDESTETKTKESPTEEASTGDENTKAPDGKDFNPLEYEQEFAREGKLSEDSYKELEKRGFTKQQVDHYIEGKRYYADSVTSRLYEAVGGEQEYAEMVTWASENLDAETIKEYNDALSNLDEGRITRTLEYMKLKKESAQPSEVRRLEGGSLSSGMQPFKDKNEWQAMATNRLYGKDAKFTNMVDARYLASRKKGIL